MENPTPQVSQQVALSRDLSLFTITMIGVGGMIGAGIFVLTGIATGVAGPALVLAFILNGIVTLFTAMSYAELGSAFPEAGGGYLWVKEGLGNSQGFLAGWMSWFAHAVAGSLYALAFGRFAAELWTMTNIPSGGLSIQQMTLGFMTLIIAIFTTINYRGASETGTVGNIVTVTKIIILIVFALFGLGVMFQNPLWEARFTDNFMPNGLVGVFLAMGLTFIAFEGYEIIAQSGEEVANPRRNIPRAIFLALGTAVAIYLLVSITVIGATIAPAELEVYQYLGQKKEIAIVQVAQQVFPFGVGALILLFSGLVSTMSALNATTFSSSRVSFAMGRDRNLPNLFARIHPIRHTPHWAVLFSGMFMLIMAWALPIEAVAAAADIMFLLLFLQVNVAVMRLRRKMPELDRGFMIPWFPVMPLIGILFNLLLALYLFTFSSIAWYTAIGWVVIGLLAYYAYFAKMEAMEKPKEILLEEVLMSRDYSVLVPVANQEQAHILGQIGAVLAHANNGEVLALDVVRVPPQLTLNEGRLFLKEGRVNLETVITHAKKRNVPVHTIIRLGRNVAEAIRQTALENASDLILLGWPGHTSTAERFFGSVIDPLVSDPPTDVALVRHRKQRPLRKVLVPVAGGPNSRLAVKLAVQMAQTSESNPTSVTLLHIIPMGSTNGDEVRGQQILNEASEGIHFEGLTQSIIEGVGVVDAVLEQSKDYDLIVLGATEEPLFKNLLLGNTAEMIAHRAKVTVIILKRRSSPLHSFMRQTILEPAAPKRIESLVQKEKIVSPEKE